MTSYAAKYISSFIVTVTSVTLCSAAIKLYGEDIRVSGVTDVMTVRSLLECSWIFKSRENSLSYNFKRDDYICELGNKYPEGSAIDDDGWVVYAPVVDGVWTNWNSGSCSVPCGGGTVTRTRTCTNPAPSNGGEPCSGDTTINAGCNGHSCIRSIGGYGASSTRVSWGTAKSKCEAEGQRLVIINGQGEQDFLAGQISGGLDHWIGMTCASDNVTTCTWLDGSSANNGFSSWAGGQPNSGGCVRIGGSGWDDTGCNDHRYFICE